MKLPLFESQLDQALASGQIAGAILLAADDNGVIYQNPAGRRGIDQDAPMDLDTVVWYASMTKAVTAACAMQLVEQGKLSLDAPAAKVLPELDGIQVMEGFDAEGKARLRPPKSQPTLRQLLTHSSGLAYEIWNVDAGRELEQRGVPNILSGTRATFERPLQADPGERWEYDVGIDFAGRMVEEVSGMRLGEYMKANLFAPLGMTEAGFTPRPDQTTRMATVHARNADLSLSPYPFELPQPPEVEMGGHGLFGTASDYLRFQRMILGGGQLQGARVLQSETVAQMSQNQMGDCSVKAMPAALPYSHAVDMYPGIDCKWGLSFMINTAQTPQGRSAGSLAWAGLANSYYWIDAKKQVCGLFVTQILPFYDPVVVPLLGTFETEIYQSLGKERSYFSSASKLSSSAPSST